MAADRKPWVGGNWKCNGTKDSVKKLVDVLNSGKWDAAKVDVAVFPTALHLMDAKTGLDKKYNVGAQNIWVKSGAFTGEFTAEMAKDAGLDCTLVGHSERRTLFGETEEKAAEKVAAALSAGLVAVLCIGETLEERNSGKLQETIEEQLKPCFEKITDWKNVVIAYEPVWAIGTGVTAQPNQAQEAHEVVRKLIKEKVSEDVAKAVRIVYGGSVSASNCIELSKLPDVDGFLVGGASLKPDFLPIIDAAASRSN